MRRFVAIAAFVLTASLAPCVRAESHRKESYATALESCRAWIRAHYDPYFDAVENIPGGAYTVATSEYARFYFIKCLTDHGYPQVVEKN